MYILSATRTFEKASTKYIKNNPKIARKLEKTLTNLIKNPFYKSLQTHKVETRNYGKKYSSRVTGDIRVIWDFDQLRKAIIVLFTLGSHSGQKKAYK